MTTTTDILETHIIKVRRNLYINTEWLRCSCGWISSAHTDPKPLSEMNDSLDGYQWHAEKREHIAMELDAYFAKQVRQREAKAWDEGTVARRDEETGEPVDNNPYLKEAR